MGGGIARARMQPLEANSSSRPKCRWTWLLRARDGEPVPSERSSSLLSGNQWVDPDNFEEIVSSDRAARSSGTLRARNPNAHRQVKPGQGQAQYVDSRIRPPTPREVAPIRRDWSSTSALSPVGINAAGTSCTTSVSALSSYRSTTRTFAARELESKSNSCATKQHTQVAFDPFNAKGRPTLSVPPGQFEGSLASTRMPFGHGAHRSTNHSVCGPSIATGCLGSPAGLHVRAQRSLQREVSSNSASASPSAVWSSRSHRNTGAASCPKSYSVEDVMDHLGKLMDESSDDPFRDSRLR